MSRRLTGAAFAFCAFATAGCVAFCGIGCAAFEGPATAGGDAYRIQCGDERCDPRWSECTTGRPVRCQARFVGSSRDAGADR